MLHETVKLDLDEAYDWYEDKKVGLGDDFLKEVQVRLADITANPQYFGSKGNRKYREAATDRFPYIIVYIIYLERKEIFICTVHNAKKSTRGKYRIP